MKLAECHRQSNMSFFARRVDRLRAAEMMALALWPEDVRGHCGVRFVVGRQEPAGDEQAGRERGRREEELDPAAAGNRDAGPPSPRPKEDEAQRKRP